MKANVFLKKENYKLLQISALLFFFILLYFLAMRRYILAALCIFFAAGCETNSVSMPSSEKEKSMSQKIDSVPPEIFRDLAESGEYVIIDLRTPEEVGPNGEGKIFKTALNMNFYAPDFEEQFSRLDRNKKYLLYCRSGARSGRVLRMAKSLGFVHVLDLKGGKMAWDRTFSH